MAGKSAYLVNKIIDMVLRGGTGANTWVTTYNTAVGGNVAAGSGLLYVGLFLVMPPNSMSGAQSSPAYEITGNNYARQQIPYGNLAAGGFTSTTGATSGVSAGTSTPGNSFNASSIQFPPPTPNGWGVAIGFGIFDNGTAGNFTNMWYSGLLGSPINCSQGGPGPFFGAGSLTIAEG
jgi:hypothetical protein